MHNNTFSDYQERIGQWLTGCFGPEVASDLTERCFRFTEESLELVQSLGVTKERVQQLVDYVFSRPVGEPHQEVGGTVVTLAALCVSANIPLIEAGETEYKRILSKMDAIRAKHFSKPKGVLSPIPGNTVIHA